MEEAAVDVVAQFAGEVEEPEWLGCMVRSCVFWGALGADWGFLDEYGKWSQDLPVGFVDDGRSHLDQGLRRVVLKVDQLVMIRLNDTYKTARLKMNEKEFF